MLDFLEQNEALVGHLHYDKNPLKAESIERIAPHFNTLLAGIAGTDQKIPDLSVLTNSNTHRLLVTRNRTKSVIPRRRVHQLFEQQPERSPDAVAVVAGRSITYRELNSKANRLAFYLSRQGAGANVRVGIYLERGVSMVVSLLTILKPGGAYQQLDPTDPEERLACMLQQAQSRLVFTREDRLPSLPSSEVPIFWFDRDWERVAHYASGFPDRELSGDNLIYVIHTPGSTGEPKAAGVYHSGFTNLLCSLATSFELSPEHRCLLIGSVRFDLLTQKNIFAPSDKSGSRHLVKEYGLRRIVNYIPKHEITWVNCTPSPCCPLIEPDDHRSPGKSDSLRHLFLDGEPIYLDKIREWLLTGATRIVNTYRPTECTDVCDADVPDPACSNKTVFIGRSIPNIHVNMLDPPRPLVPVEIKGELTIGGPTSRSGRPSPSSPKCNSHSRLGLRSARSSVWSSPSVAF